MTTENLNVTENTTHEEIRTLLHGGAKSVTRPVSPKMEDVFVLCDGRLWQLTNCYKRGFWQQVSQTCIDQEYDADGNEMY